MNFTPERLTQINSVSNALGIQSTELIAAFFAVYSAHLINKVQPAEACQKSWEQVLSGLDYLATQVTTTGRDQGNVRRAV